MQSIPKSVDLMNIHICAKNISFVVNIAERLKRFT